MISLNIDPKRMDFLCSPTIPASPTHIINTR
jgi:hypothetical protein